MRNMTFYIASGQVEVRKAIDVFGKDAFSEYSFGMSTYQFDSLTGKNKFFHQDDYYFFPINCNDGAISDLEKTIKQGVWL
jgi:hypothetical protein